MKKIILLILIIVFVSETFAQTTEEKNLEKYWFYRERLEQYYMVMGKGAGEGLPAVGRNSYTTKLNFNENPFLSAFGPYLGVLATEYKLLQNNGQSTAKTLEALYYALYAISRLDMKAEQTYGRPNDVTSPTDPASLNGFMLRDDVPLTFIDDHPELNAGLTLDDIFEPNVDKVDKMYYNDKVFTTYSQTIDAVWGSFKIGYKFNNKS